MVTKRTLYSVLLAVLCVSVLSDASVVEASAFEVYVPISETGVVTPTTLVPYYTTAGTDGDGAYCVYVSYNNGSSWFRENCDANNDVTPWSPTSMQTLLDIYEYPNNSFATVTMKYFWIEPGDKHPLVGRVPATCTSLNSYTQCEADAKVKVSFTRINGVWSAVGVPPPTLTTLTATSSYETRVLSLSAESINLVPVGTTSPLFSNEHAYSGTVSNPTNGKQTLSCSAVAGKVVDSITFRIIDPDIYSGGTVDVTIAGVSSPDTLTVPVSGSGEIDHTFTISPTEIDCVGTFDVNFSITKNGNNYPSPKSDAGYDTYADGQFLWPDCSGCSTFDTWFIVNGRSIVGSGDTEITAEYFLNTDEIVSTVSAKNPTAISFELSKQPGTTTDRQGENINNTQNGTGTVTTTFTSLEDGVYDILARFSNTGCFLEQSECPFPLSYVYGTLVIENGIVQSITTDEVYNNTNPPPLISQYEDCGLTNISGCLNNSLRFLFIPSSSVIDDLVQLKEIAETKAPFAYATDMAQVLSELTQTADAQTLDMTVDLGFGEVTIIDEAMIAGAPYASTIRQLLVYLLWLSFAFAMYRIALGIHDHDNRTI